MKIGAVITLFGIIAAIVFFVRSPLRSETFAIGTDGASANPLAFSRDGEYLIAGTDFPNTGRKDPKHWQGELSVWNLASKKKVHAIIFPQWIRSLSMSQKGNLLAVSCGCIGSPLYNTQLDDVSIAGELRIFSFPQMQELKKLQEGWSISSASLSPDGSLLATAIEEVGAEAEIKVWNVDKLEMRYVVKGVKAGRSWVQFSPDGSRLAIIDSAERSRKPMIRQLKSKDGELINEFRIEGWIRSFRFTPDGNRIFPGDYAVTSWDSRTGKQLELKKNPPFIWGRGHSTLSDDGRWFVVGYDRYIEPGRHAQIFIWDVENERIHSEWKISNAEVGIQSIAMSPDNKTVVVGSDKLYFFATGIK